MVIARETTRLSDLPDSRIAELYRAYLPGARRIAYLLVGDTGQAEDLAQDAFLKVAGRFADLRDPEAFGPYLRRTVINLARSAYRRRQVENKHTSPRAPLLVEGPNIDERDAMWRRLQGLPSRQRAALVLRFYEDLTEADTAEILHCKVGTVKSLVHRALKTLRTEGEP
jgi:RNA polymerase sigma-70 factor (sigma-E family)